MVGMPKPEKPVGEDLTNHILCLIDPVLQPGYTGRGVDVSRIISALKRISMIDFMQEICQWHIDCERQEWGSGVALEIDYDEERPFVPDTVLEHLGEDEKSMTDRLMEIMDEYGSGEPDINGFIDRIVKKENAGGWSTTGWRERLILVATSIEFDLPSYFSARCSHDLDENVGVVAETSKPGPRM